MGFLSPRRTHLQYKLAATWCSQGVGQSLALMCRVHTLWMPWLLLISSIVNVHFSYETNGANKQPHPSFALARPVPSVRQLRFGLAIPHLEVVRLAEVAPLSTLIGSAAPSTVLNWSPAQNTTDRSWRIEKE